MLLIRESKRRLKKERKLLEIKMKNTITRFMRVFEENVAVCTSSIIDRIAKGITDTIAMRAIEKTMATI